MAADGQKEECYMSQINVNSLTFGYEGSFDNIFEDVSFSVDTDWRLGFIGRNGKGKTTFLRLLLGQHAYSGSISASTRFEYFPYELTDEQMKKPAAEFLDEIKPECEVWRVICELDELDESAEILYRPFITLSPGERTKILLAVLFSGENEFLLIDEPTNHLDGDARKKVRDYLRRKKSYILVSHDRALLDECTDHVLVLNRRSIEVQSGNFSSWWENKQRKDSFALAQDEKHRKEIRKLRQAARRTTEWADKSERTKIGFDPIKEHDRCISTRSFIGAKTKKMQSRVKQMEKRIDREIEQKEGLLEDLEKTDDLKLAPLSHHKAVLVSLKELKLGYKGAAGPVINGLTLEIKRGDRIALHGENGCGKTTLIKAILQSCGLQQGCGLEQQGVLETASGLKISYISQDTSQLKGRADEFCEQQGLDRSLFCSVLRRLGLERAQFEKDISDYSQGQKKKVLLASSLVTPAHLYIWDEPLNYIDIFSRMQIEKLLLEYRPTMLFVEHDAAFREKIATDTVEL